MPQNLNNYVCVVTGSTRGIGKAIAIALGEAGATVYITGRTFEPAYQRNTATECLKETARIIEERGGKAIPVAVDHSDDNQVAGLFARIRREQAGRLDILVNNAFAATDYLLKEACSDSVYWEPSTKMRGPSEEWDLVNRVGLRNSYTCCVLATRMMVDCRINGAIATNHANVDSSIPQSIRKLPTGLIINISSIGGSCRLFNVAFCAGKSALDRMTMEMARDLSKRGIDVSVVSLMPGLVLTETVIAAIQSGRIPVFMEQAINFHLDIPAELPGRLIVTLASLPRKDLAGYSGRVLFGADLASRFGLRKPDGSYPQSPRSVRTILQLSGWKRLATLVPPFIKIPLWVLALMTSKF